MTELDFYSIECRKHGMTYGEYERAIRNGLLPKPKFPKTRRIAPSLTADENEDTYRKCKNCGKMFLLPAPDSRRKYCPECLPETGKSRRTISDYYACDLCGAEFYRGRYDNGKAKEGKFCPECYDKWLHMSTQQKKAFKAGERTLERLEMIRNGRTPDVCENDN